MGKADRVVRRIYLREHSIRFRRAEKKSYRPCNVDDIVEDPTVELEDRSSRIFKVFCRNKQRLCQAAWSRWVQATGVFHDYAQDLRIILLRNLPEDTLRTELEIEVMFKWVMQQADVDPTGIARPLLNCKSKRVVVHALQHMRLECYHPHDGIVFQDNLPKSEDGHFTVFRGECEVIQFQQNSIPLMKLQILSKQKKWDEVRNILEHAQSLATIAYPAGFGELSTLTEVKRAATVRAGKAGAELLVLPKQDFLDLSAAQRDAKDGALPSEAIDFLRQSGLAQKISASDLVAAAKNVIKRTLNFGEVLFCTGEPVNSIFLVVSGEFVLDVSEPKPDGMYAPFMNSNIENCYHLGAGSILGDEGLLGQAGRFLSTAVAVSEMAVAFEAVGFGLTFLAERLGASRYCALAYKDLPRWTPGLRFADQANLYGHFHSLRRCIAYQKPFRGSKTKSYLPVGESAQADEFNSPLMMLHRPYEVEELEQVQLQTATSAGDDSKLEWRKEFIQTRGRRQAGAQASQAPSIQANLAMPKQKPLATLGPSLSSQGFNAGGAPLVKQQSSGQLRRSESGAGVISRQPSGTNGVSSSATASAKKKGVASGTVANKQKYPVANPTVVLSRQSDGGTIRYLSATAVHHANEVNKIAKKKFQDFFKISAQENILEHELHLDVKHSTSKVGFNLLRETEQKLRRAMASYRTRISERAQMMLMGANPNVPVPVSKLHALIHHTMNSMERSNTDADVSSTEASTIVEDASAGVIGGEEKRDEDERGRADSEAFSNGLDSISAASDPTFIRQVLAASMVTPLSKIELYFMFLDRQQYRFIHTQSEKTPPAPKPLEESTSTTSTIAEERYSKWRQQQKEIHQIDTPQMVSGRQSPATGLDMLEKNPLNFVHMIAELSGDHHHGVLSHSVMQIDQVNPRKLRAKFEHSTLTPWRPSSPESKRLDPLVLPVGGREISPPRRGRSKSPAKLDYATVNGLRPSSTSPERLGTASSEVFDKKKGKSVEDKVTAGLEKFLRPSAPNSRRCIPLAQIGEEADKIIDKELDAVLKRIDKEKSIDFYDDKDFLNKLAKVDFPVLKKHKPGEEWNTRFPTLRGNPATYGEVETSKRLAKLLVNEGLVAASDTDSIVEKKLKATKANQKRKSKSVPKVQPERALDEEDALDDGELSLALAGLTVGDRGVPGIDVSQLADSIASSREESHRSIEAEDAVVGLATVVEGVEGAEDHVRTSREVVQTQSEPLEVSMQPLSDTAPPTPHRTHSIATRALSPAAKGFFSRQASVGMRADTNDEDENSPLASPVYSALLSPVQNHQPVHESPQRLSCANPRSAALDKYMEVMCEEKPSRRFLDGKRKSLRESRFRISAPPEFGEPEKFQTGFLNTLESCIVSNLRRDIVDKTKPWKDRDTANLSEQKIHERNAEIQNRLNELLLESYRPTSVQAAFDMAKHDPDVSSWQDFLVQTSCQFKSGPKMTFPVLVRSAGHNASPKRTKRWGTGQMAMLEGDSANEGITGPPSYLDVYKRQTVKHRTPGLKPSK